MSSTPEQTFAGRVNHALLVGSPSEWRMSVTRNTISVIDEEDNEYVLIVKEIFNAKLSGDIALPNPHLSGGDFVADSALFASPDSSDEIPEEFGRVIGRVPEGEGRTEWFGGQ